MLRLGAAVAQSATAPAFFCIDTKLGRKCVNTTQKSVEKCVNTTLNSQGTRARELEQSMQWLTESDLMRQICRVTKPDLSMDVYHDGTFKGFVLAVLTLLVMTFPQITSGNDAERTWRGQTATQ